VLTPADVIKFAYFHHLRKWWSFIALLLAFCLFGIAVCLSTGDPSRLRNPGVSYILGLLLASIQLAIPYVSGRMQYARTKLLREPMRFYITSEKVSLQGASYSSEMTWALVKSVHETRNAFLIYQTSKVAWILPKRFFWGNADLEAHFRQLLSRTLGQRWFPPASFLLHSWF
jgi:hypothetical protein